MTTDMKCETCTWRDPETCKVCRQDQRERERRKVTARMQREELLDATDGLVPIGDVYSAYRYTPRR